MKDEFIKLAALAKIDQGIKVLTDNQNEGPGYIKELEDKILKISKEFDEKTSTFGTLDAEKKAKELELTEKRDWITKREPVLNDIKTNKEYHAALKEIEQTKKTVENLENDVIALMTKLEEQTSSYSLLKDELETKKNSIQAEINEEKLKLSTLGLEIETKLKDRNQFESQISPSLLKKYDNIRNRVFPALSMVEEGSCTECNTSLPPQLYIEIQRANKIILCPSCYRILHTNLDEGKNQ